MASPIFDTHAFVKRLTEAGMPELQAEILASEQSRLLVDHLATKNDLAAEGVGLRSQMKELEFRLQHQMQDLEGRLQHQMQDLRYELKQDMKELEFRMVIKLGGLMAASVGLVAAIMRIF